MKARALLRQPPLWGPILGAVVAVAGCGRTVTESDCSEVKENMRAAWSAEARKAAPADPAGAERAGAVIRAEGDKLVNDWMSECKKELMGRRVEPKEMDCLLHAKTIDAINKCGE
jgi:hypothetical protein